VNFSFEFGNRLKPKTIGVLMISRRVLDPRLEPVIEKIFAVATRLPHPVLRAGFHVEALEPVNVSM
jgi:hypothetical protein